MKANNVCICCHELIKADEATFSPAIMLRHNYSKLEVLTVHQDLEKAVETGKLVAASMNLPLTCSFKYANRPECECEGIKPWEGERSNKASGPDLTKYRVDQYCKVYDEKGVFFCKWDSLTESEQEIIKQNPASAIINGSQDLEGCSEEYVSGYRTGQNERRSSLNINYNGSTSVYAGARLLGFLDGLHGTKPRSYCIQNGNNCYTCPLCSYGFDCKNNAVPFVNKEGSIQNAGTY